MNIGYDIQSLFNNYRNRGVGVYNKCLINEVEKCCYESEHVYKFNCYGDSVKSVSTNNLKTYSIRKNTVDDFVREDDQFYKIVASQMQHFCSENDIDIVHFLTPFFYETASLLEFPQKTAKVVTIYDYIHLVFPEYYLTDRTFKINYMRQIGLLSGFDAYITISGHTAKDLIHYTGVPADKVYSIDLGIDSDFKVLAEKEYPELKERLGIADKFILNVGGFHFTKNALEVVKAYANLDSKLISEYQLVMCGLPSDKQDELNSLVQEGGNRVVLLPHIKKDELVKLYNMAELYVFPSKYEGFGIPVLEAFACGTPVVTSNNSSIAEIAEGCAVQVDPFSRDSILKGIQYALTNPVEMKRLAEAGLAKSKKMTWGATAKNTLDAYREIVERKKESRKAQYAVKAKKHIAWFSPLPPLKSGISGYSYELLMHLMRRMNIDVFIDIGYTPDVPGLTDCNVYPYTAFEQMQSKQKYDAIIYQMGASDYHTYLMGYIKKHPGIVVNHDAEYHNLLLHITNSGTLEDEYREALRLEFGQKAGDEIFTEVRNDIGSWQKHTVNSYHLGETKSIVVLTESNKRKLLEKEIGRHVSVIPLHTWLPKNFNALDVVEIKNEFGLPSDALIIGSFGFLHPSKRNLEALKAFELLAKKMDNVYFCLVGKCFPEYQDELLNVANRNPGLIDRIKLVGAVSDEVFYKYMKITDVFIGLRSKGSSNSGPLLKALGAGVPCIVSDIDSFGDLNSECIFKIENDGSEIDDIASVLLELLSCDEKRKKLGQIALELSKDYFSLDSVADKYEKVINDFENVSKKILISNSDIDSLISVFGNGLKQESELARIFSEEISKLNQLSLRE